MNARAGLEPPLENLSEERLNQLLAFARFLAVEDERGDWKRFGRTQLARTYGADEPDYTEADLKLRDKA